MSLRIRFQYPTGAKLAISIERLADGWFLDFASSTFTAAPASPLGMLPEDSGIFLGRYKLTLATSAITFADGDYVVTVHDAANGNVVVAELGATMFAGNDSTVTPAPPSPDPLAAAVPGSYPVGSAGHTLGVNLDAKVSGVAAAPVPAPVSLPTSMSFTLPVSFASQANNPPPTA